MSALDFRTVYRRYYRLVWWVVQGSGVPEAWREDVVQDAFVAIHRRLPERDPDDALRPWVIGLARNAAFTHRRSAARREARHAAVPTPDIPTAVDSAVAYRQAWDQVHHFLDGLDQDQREAFVLCDLEGLPPAEVASTLRVSRNTVYSRLRLARGKLVDHFSERRPAQLPGLLRAARTQGGPTTEHKRRTWAALALQLPLAESVTAAGTGITGASSSVSTGLTAVAMSLGISAVAVGVIAIGARVLGPSTPTERPTVAERAPDENEPRRSAPTETPDDAPPLGPAPTAAPPIVEAPATDTAPSPSKGNRAKPTSPNTLEDEVALLQQATQRLQANDAVGALTILDRHVKRYPSSDVSNERVAIRVRALCAKGDTRTAESVAASFVSRHPNSRLAASLKEPCPKP
ncbi:MAG: sigma-70 family RNA polymerase sigma factor [Myxococcota bacterium]